MGLPVPNGAAVNAALAESLPQLSPWMDWAQEMPTLAEPEVGYRQRTSFEGRGLMTEAVLGVAQSAFETLFMARVKLRCDLLNTRRRVTERADFQLEGRLRNAARDPRGDLGDTLIYSRLNPAG